MNNFRKYISEMFGTMFFVMFGCGIAALNGDDVFLKAFSFGLALMISLYIFGPISGGHFNPIISISKVFVGEISLKNMIIYIVFQLIGAILGIILLIMMLGTDISYGANYVKQGYELYQGLLAEMFFSFVFVLTILGVTSKSIYKPVSGLIIGLCLTLIYILESPIAGEGINPAKSVATAIFSADLTAASQLWIFILMPVIGGILAAVLWEMLFSTKAK